MASTEQTQNRPHSHTLYPSPAHISPQNLQNYSYLFPISSDQNSFQSASIQRSFYPWNLRDMFLGSFYGGIGGFAINAFDRRMASAIEIPRQGIALFFNNFRQRFPRVAPPMTVGYVGLVVPIVEETLFNGIFRDFMRENQTEPHSCISGAVRALTIASSFTLCHVEFFKGVQFNLRVCKSAFVAGLAFSTITEITGSLWGSTFAHSLINLLTFKRVNRIR